MTRIAGKLEWILIGLLAATSVSAEQYDFDIGLSIDRTGFDGSQTITTTGGSIFNSSEIDTDNFVLSGNWFFAGLSDDKGPRSRAAFVDRASSLSFSYGRTERSSTTILNVNDPSLPFGSGDFTFDSDGDAFAANFRYVDRDSGWFGDVGLSNSDTTLFGSVIESNDVTGWQLGAGKYLFETTAISFDYGEADSNGRDVTIYGVSFEHLGDLGSSWQYGVDIGYNRVDPEVFAELETWRAALALYPSSDIELGVAVEERSGFLPDDQTNYEAFASWFVKPNVRISARYGVDDVDYFGNVAIGGAPRESSVDQTSFGISATVRF